MACGGSEEMTCGGPGTVFHSGGFGGRALRLICAQGSSENLKPAAVMEAFCAFVKADFDPCGFRVVRLDLYDGEMRPLSELGEDFS